MKEKRLKKKKRDWIYVQQPTDYDFSCNLCHGKNITWSEWEGHIWCFDCEKDVIGENSIFDGPIPYELTQMLGISFDKIDLKTKKRLYMKVKKDGAGVMWSESENEG